VYNLEIYQIVNIFLISANGNSYTKSHDLYFSNSYLKNLYNSLELTEFHKESLNLTE